MRRLVGAIRAFLGFSPIDTALWLKIALQDVLRAVEDGFFGPLPNRQPRWVGVADRSPCQHLPVPVSLLGGDLEAPAQVSSEAMAVAHAASGSPARRMAIRTCGGLLYPPGRQTSLESVVGVQPVALRPPDLRAFKYPIPVTRVLFLMGENFSFGSMIFWTGFFECWLLLLSDARARFRKGGHLLGNMSRSAA